MITALVIAFSGSDSGAASSESADSRAQGSAARVSAPDTCFSAHRAIRFYHGRWHDHRQVVGAQGHPSHDRATGCERASYLAQRWKGRSFSMRQVAEKVLDVRTLRDFPFAPGNHAWLKAVREVQKVFPGTEGWLLSCSAAEGGHGRWVGYSGVSYSTWLRDSDTVGGNLQYRFSTFQGMYRRAVDYATGRGFRVPRMDMTTAWRSALGQALAGAWARYTGNDDSHWSASWGRGC